ncbi:MAG: AMP-binding protein [Burkholderiaceae bacterium]
MSIEFQADGLTPKLSGTVYQAFLATVERWPDQAFVCVPSRTAQAYGIDAGEITYRAFAERVEVLRAGYAAAGYGHGLRAGLLLENRPDFFLHWFALNALGVSVVPINGEFRVAELSYLIENSGMCLAVSLPGHHDRLTEAAVRAGKSLTVVAPGMLPSPGSAPVLHRDDEPDVNTECALLYTSGTTGRPKGCILPNEYFLFAGTWYRELGGYCELRAGEDRLLSPLPLVHMNAMAVSSMVMLLIGGTIVLADRFHPAAWWDTVRESRATVVHYLGVMPAMLLGAPESVLDRVHTVRFGFGAGVDPRDHAAFEQRFGFPLVEGWAMTETGAGGCIMASVEPRKVGTRSFGCAPAGVAARVVDEAGNDVDVDAPGELLVRWAGADPHFGFFKGYLKNAQATDEAWAGGWFHTGDIVRRDADGDFHFIDRKKNVIRRSGENIAAVEVEGVLMQHAAVAAVGVAPVPDPVRGDEVMACVVTAPGSLPDARGAADIVAHCLSELAYFKAPGYIAFVSALPLTATQKIQRGELRTLAADCLAALSTPASQGNEPTVFDLRDMKRRDHGAPSA